MATTRKYAKSVNTQLLDLIRKLITDAEYAIDDLRQRSQELHVTSESDLKRTIHEYLKAKVEKLELEICKMLTEKVSEKEMEIEKCIADLEKRREKLEQHEKDVRRAIPPSSLSHLPVTKKDILMIEQTIEELKDRGNVKLHFNFCHHAMNLVDKCNMLGDIRFVKASQESKLDHYLAWSCSGDTFSSHVPKYYRKSTETPRMTSNLSGALVPVDLVKQDSMVNELPPLMTHRSSQRVVASTSRSVPSASSAPAQMYAIAGTVTPGRYGGTDMSGNVSPTTLPADLSDLESGSTRKGYIIHSKSSGDVLEPLTSRRTSLEPKLRAVTELSLIKMTKLNYIQFDRTLSFPKNERTRAIYGLDFMEGGQQVVTDSNNRLLYFDSNNQLVSYNSNLQGIPYDLCVLTENKIAVTMSLQMKNLLKVFYIGNDEFYKVRSDFVIDCPMAVHTVCCKNDVMCVACPKELRFFAVNGLKLHPTDRFSLRHRGFDRLRMTRYDVTCNELGNEFYYIQSDVRRVVAGGIEETILENRNMWQRRWAFSRDDVTPGGICTYEGNVFVANSHKNSILEFASDGDLLRELTDNELDHPGRIGICDATKTLLVVQNKRYDDETRISRRAVEVEVLVFSFD